MLNFYGFLGIEIIFSITGTSYNYMYIISSDTKQRKPLLWFFCMCWIVLFFLIIYCIFYFLLLEAETFSNLLWDHQNHISTAENKEKKTFSNFSCRFWKCNTPINCSLKTHIVSTLILLCFHWNGITKSYLRTHEHRRLLLCLVMDSVELPFSFPMYWCCSHGA